MRLLTVQVYLIDLSCLECKINVFNSKLNPQWRHLKWIILNINWLRYLISTLNLIYINFGGWWILEVKGYIGWNCTLYARADVIEGILHMRYNHPCNWHWWTDEHYKRLQLGRCFEQFILFRYPQILNSKININIIINTRMKDIEIAGWRI